HRMEPGKTLLGKALAKIAEHDAWRQLARAAAEFGTAGGLRGTIGAVAQRRYVNAFLGVWLAVLAVDAFRPLVGAQRSIDDAIHSALDVTGLRQFPWRLFAEVPRVNLRFSATLEFSDGATAHWDSPDWR